ncbi:MAG: YgaP family membrane protein [Bacillota bacterium]
MAGMLRMEQNVGQTDRYLRITFGSLLLACSAAHAAREGGMAGLGTGLLGGMMLAEGVLGSCPIYSLAGVDTREEQTNDVIRPYEGI